MPIFKNASALALLLILPACSSQAPPDYRGEALTTITGNLRQHPETSSDAEELEVAIMWGYGVQTEDGPEGRTVLSAVRVESALPAKFRMDVLEAPPEEAYTVDLGLDEWEVSPLLGNIVAIRAGTAASIENEFDPDILGFSIPNSIVYVPANASPDSLKWWAERYNFPAEPGFHMITGGTDASMEKLVYEWERGGICEHRVKLDASTAEQKFYDEKFRRCQHHLPDAPTCTSYDRNDGQLTDEQQEENQTCHELLEPFWEQVSEGKVESIGPPLWKYIRTEGDMDFPVTIELGTTYWDWQTPTYLE